VTMRYSRTIFDGLRSNRDARETSLWQTSNGGDTYQRISYSLPRSLRLRPS